MSVTAAAGGNAALVFALPDDTDDPPTVTIIAADSTVALAPTAVGVGAAGDGSYTYVWQVPGGQAPGLYTATLSGQIAAAPVSTSVTVAVTTLPVYASLDLVKHSLISGGQIKDARDDLLREKLESGARSIDDHTGRRFWLDSAPVTRVLRTRGRVVCDDDGERLLVPDIGDVDNLVVEVGRGSTWQDITDRVEVDPPDATVDQQPVTSLLYGSWGTARRARVTARWGWPAVPQPIREANLIQALRLFARRGSPEGVLGSAEWGGIRVSRLDPDVAALVGRYVVDGFG
jgi:hypothetical protein